MRKINIGIILDQNYSSGGGYLQAIRTLDVLKKSDLNEFANIFIYTTKKNNILHSNHSLTYINLNFFRRVLLILRSSLPIYVFKIISKFFKYNYFEKILNRNAIDIVYFLSPSRLAYSLENINFVMSIWDICHRESIGFPEVYVGKEFEERELFYRNILPKAYKIIVESNQTAQNLVEKYLIFKERLFVFPLQATIDDRYKVDILSKYKIEYPYIFYPAQYWSHKNHTYIIDCLYDLINIHDIKINVVFTGYDNGNLEFLKKYISNLRLENYIRLLGYVSEDEMASFYRGSIALVMPTFFGPTNLPPLEAFKLGVPVLTSKIKSFQDQYGDAAIYVDLMDFKSLSSQVIKLMIDEDYRKKYIMSGKNFYSEYIEMSHKVNLIEVFREYSSISKCWK
jgi:glycosyltransferase involved in cell wall biosynthesis